MLIELNEARLDQFINLYDISGIHGNAAMFEIQTEAGVDTCDVFYALNDKLQPDRCHYRPKNWAQNSPWPEFVTRSIPNK